MQRCAHEVRCRLYCDQCSSLQFLPPLTESADVSLSCRLGLPSSMLCCECARKPDRERLRESVRGRRGPSFDPLPAHNTPTCTTESRSGSVSQFHVSILFDSLRGGVELKLQAALRLIFVDERTVVALVIIVRYIDFTSGIGTIISLFFSYISLVRGSWFIMFNCTNRNDRMNEISNLVYFQETKTNLQQA